jgi:hypothetical protein
VNVDWASEHLQVIRTLMERSAVYRRALAPMMLLAGVSGCLAAGLGLGFGIHSPRAFIAYWLAVGSVAVAAALVLVRREALRDGEPFWSPPARRVARAILPALLSGLAISLVILVRVDAGSGTESDEVVRKVALTWLPLGWVILYGCACHAAGFFMPRGIKLFGWAFVAGGCGLFALPIPWAGQPVFAHVLMGLFFGLLHLAYGAYLYVTDRRKNAV